MHIKVNSCVNDPDHVTDNAMISVNSPILKRQTKDWDRSDTIAYSPLINAHDHLIGNWFPRAGENRPYENVSSWVDEMRRSKPFLERNRVWENDGAFDLTQGNARLVTRLGIYKNIFSGCAAVQDHITKQKDEYYEDNPILVLKDYTQCHSLSMGNWWGGKTAIEEYQESKGKIPFVTHVGEGVDDDAKKCFGKLEEYDLVKPNTLLVHGISFSREQIKKCAENNTSICWCPGSNLFLIGKTIDIESCLEFGVNVVLGTDSTMSGSSNLLSEIRFAKQNFPQIPMKEIFRMVSTNARRALFLPDAYGTLQEQTDSLLLLKMKEADPFDNILHIAMDDIALFMHDGIPVYGDAMFLDEFDVDVEDYYLFGVTGGNKFVKGHPEMVIEKIDTILGYHKRFPFIPF